MISYENIIYPMLNSFIRLNGSDAEVTKAELTCSWLLENSQNVKSKVKPEHAEIVKIIYKTYWDSKHKNDWDVTKPGVTLTLKKLGELVEESTSVFGSGMITAMEELAESDRSYTTTEDLDIALGQLQDHREESNLIYFASGIKKAIVGNLEIKHKRKNYEGLTGAKQWIFDCMEDGLLSQELAKDISRVVNEDTQGLIDLYEEEELDKHHTISSGMAHLDEAVQMKRGHLVGVLGYNKHRKTTFLRSIAYKALLKGLNVLWISLEQTYEEEREAFQLLHCHTLFPKSTVSASKINRHTLTAVELGQLTEAGERLDQLRGKLKVVEPSNRSWANIKNRVEMEQLTEKYDICVIDYLALVGGENKDKRSGMEDIIMDAKQLAKSQKLLLMTPIQGNRAGSERARDTPFWNADPNTYSAQCGCWDKEGIDTYSEFNKSCDTIFSVYYDSECKAKKEIIIGLVLCRRSDDMVPLVAKVNNESGLIYSFMVRDEVWTD